MKYINVTTITTYRTITIITKINKYTFMNSSKFTCKVGKANSQGNSLKCTIPQQVVLALQISHEDTIKWIVKEDNNQVRVTVEKLIL